METDTPVSPALAEFIDQLLRTTHPLISIFDHMTSFERSGRPDPDALPATVVLPQILGGVLTPLAAKHGDDGLRRAAAVIDGALDLIASELFLVGDDELPNDFERRTG